MTNQSFKDFVTAKAAEASQPAVDWGQVKEDWIIRLGDLVNNVTKWLEPYKENIGLEPRVVQLTEEMIGSYQAPMLVITIGHNVVSLEPVGRFLIGVAGRVDIKGPKGIARLLVVPKDSSGPRIQVKVAAQGQTTSTAGIPPVSEWVWKFASPPPAIRYTDLTEESFLDALMGVVNG